MKTTVSAKYWKEVFKQNLITKEDIRLLQSIDPSPTKKYLDFLVKIWVKERSSVASIDELRNYIEEFHTLTENHRIRGIDVNMFRSYEEFKNFVNVENEKASASVEELENDYEVVRDDEDLLIVIPYTHEASRKLGLRYFGTRADKTCAWCTTYATNTHFNKYFYTDGVTFYYVKVRSKELQQQIYNVTKSKSLFHVALVVNPDGTVEGYNEEDSAISSANLTKFRKIIGI